MHPSCRQLGVRAARKFRLLSRGRQSSPSSPCAARPCAVGVSPAVLTLPKQCVCVDEMLFTLSCPSSSVYWGHILFVSLVARLRWPLTFGRAGLDALKKRNGLEGKSTEREPRIEYAGKGNPDRSTPGYAVAPSAGEKTATAEESKPTLRWHGGTGLPSQKVRSPLSARQDAVERSCSRKRLPLSSPTGVVWTRRPPTACSPDHAGALASMKHSSRRQRGAKRDPRGGGTLLLRKAKNTSSTATHSMRTMHSTKIYGEGKGREYLYGSHQGETKRSNNPTPLNSPSTP